MNLRARYLWIALAITSLIAVPLGWSYWATQHVPAFYAEALRVEPAAQRVASTEMFNSTMALVQNVRRTGRWQAEFTMPQINGWMAVDLEENHPTLLDDSVSEPRVSLQSGQATLAYRYESAAVSTVVSVVLDVYLAKPNLVAVRIKQVRAGALPMPLNQVLDSIAEAATEAGWQLEWRQQDGDPVALVHVPEIRDDGDADKRLHLDEILVRDGSIYLAGHTKVNDSAMASGTTVENVRPRVVDQSGSKSRRHR